MTITEEKVNGRTYTQYHIDKNEFVAMSNEEKIHWLRKPRTSIQGIPRCELLKIVNDNTVIIRSTKTYKKFLLDLNTCKKTPITQDEYESQYTSKKADKIKALEKQIAELQAQLEKLRG
jgi:hypothetical protein